MHRAITVCQPWAAAIVAGFKRYENRTWSTRYRGPLLIHAGLSTRWVGSGREAIEGLGIPVPPLAFGAILGSVDLVRCFEFPRHATQQAKSDPLAEGPVCWELARPRRLAEAVPCKGSLGLFGVPDRLLAGARWEPQCRVCGCTQTNGCRPTEGCAWAEEGLCTTCRDLEAAARATGPALAKPVAPHALAERIDSQCPCGQAISALLGPGGAPRFFVAKAGAWKEIRACPKCRQDGFLRLTAEQIKERIWQ